MDERSVDILMRAIRKSRPFIFKTAKEIIRALEQGKLVRATRKAMRTVKDGKLVLRVTKGANKMVKMKAGGIVLGGIAAYLILSKGISAMDRMVRNVCVAHEWKNYYKYGKEGNMVPPGYASHTRQINNNEERVTESPEELAAKEKEAQENTSNKGLGAQFAEAIVKAVSDVFTGSDKAKTDAEGQETVSEEDICHEDGDTDGDDAAVADDRPYEYVEAIKEKKENETDRD